MTLEKIIRKQLEKTRHCKSKNAMVRCLYKKGYVLINLKKFPRELAKVIKKEISKLTATKYSKKL